MWVADELDEHRQLDADRFCVGDAPIIMSLTRYHKIWEPKYMTIIANVDRAPAAAMIRILILS